MSAPAPLAAWYVAGDWVAISAPGRWLIVQISPRNDAVRRLWKSISGRASVEDVLDLLVAGGLRATPPFALAWLGPDGGRIVVRGSATARAGTAEQMREITAEPGATWRDELLPVGVEHVVLAAMSESELVGQTGAVELPMAEGVTRAGMVVLRAGSALEDAPAAPVEASAAAAGPAPSLSKESFGTTQVGVALPPHQTVGWDTLGSPPEPAEPPTPPPHSLSDPTAPVPLTGPVPTPPRPAVAQGGPGGVIDSVPWVTGEVPSASAPTEVVPPHSLSPASVTSGPRPSDPTPPPLGVQDINAQTLNRDALPQAGPPGYGAAPQPMMSVPTVLAARCPYGHLTPAHSATCRVCGYAVAPQEAYEIPRPPLGVLRLSTGDTITVDRGVLIGRAPSLPAGSSERPHLVQVSSPQHDVSRTHAEIVLDGWHVFVRDLGSTNGTTVTLPGQHPFRLRDGDLQLLEHGTLIVLADEIACAFEVLA